MIYVYQDFSIFDRVQNWANGLRHKYADFELVAKHPHLTQWALNSKFKRKQVLDPDKAFTIPQNYTDLAQKIYNSDQTSDWVRNNFELQEDPSRPGVYKIRKNPNSEYTNDKEGYKRLTRDTVSMIDSLNAMRRGYDASGSQDQHQLDAVKTNEAFDQIGKLVMDNRQQIAQAMKDRSENERLAKEQEVAQQQTNFAYMPMQSNSQWFENETAYKPYYSNIPKEFIGKIVSIARPGAYKHYGIATGPNEISEWGEFDDDTLQPSRKYERTTGQAAPSKPGKSMFRKVTVDQFLNGQNKNDLYFEPTKLKPKQVMKNIKKFQEKAHEYKYNPASMNCEHVARMLGDGVARSGQVDTVKNLVQPMAPGLTDVAANIGRTALATGQVPDVPIDPAVKEAAIKAFEPHLQKYTEKKATDFISK